jgi:membrane-associated protein
MDPLQRFLDVFLHLDRHLSEWAGDLGPWLYLVLFAVVFCETGLVVTPFLPGDSLLFAAGALAALPDSPLNVTLLCLTLCVAAVAGDAVNYSIGRRFGERLLARGDTWYLKRRHLERTQTFYERHGGQTIVLARFMPIVRTFAPFVAGLGRMSYRRFAAFNVVGGVAWVVLFLLAGYWFGNLPFVQKNFHYVILAIIVLSILPGVIQYLRERSRKTPPPT